MANPRGTPTPVEVELFRTALHPVSCANALGLAGFILFVGSVIIRHNELSTATELRVALVSAALGAAVLVGPFLRLRRSEVVVTPSRLHLRLATWRATTTDVPVRELRAVDARSSVLGRRLDFGTITVTRADDATIVVHHVRAPLALRDALRRAVGRR